MQKQADTEAFGWISQIGFFFFFCNHTAQSI